WTAATRCSARLPIVYAKAPGEPPEAFEQICRRNPTSSASGSSPRSRSRRAWLPIAEIGSASSPGFDPALAAPVRAAFTDDRRRIVLRLGIVPVLRLGQV